eukprot:CFRG8319T1
MQNTLLLPPVSSAYMTESGTGVAKATVISGIIEGKSLSTHEPPEVTERPIENYGETHVNGSTNGVGAEEYVLRHVTERVDRGFTLKETLLEFGLPEDLIDKTLLERGSATLPDVTPDTVTSAKSITRKRPHDVVNISQKVDETELKLKTKVTFDVGEHSDHDRQECVLSETRADRGIVQTAVALIISWIQFNQHLEEEDQRKIARLEKVKRANGVRVGCGRAIATTSNISMPEAKHWSVALNMMLDEDPTSLVSLPPKESRDLKSIGYASHRPRDVEELPLKARELSDKQLANGSHVVVLDDFFTEEERKDLLDVMSVPGWDHRNGPPHAKWERMTCDAAGLPPTWGLKQEVLDRLLGEDSSGPPPEVVRCIQTRLCQLYSDFVITHIPSSNAMDKINYSAHPFVGNAVVAGDTFVWHVDADPMFLPGHGHQNRTPGKPYFVTLLLYLNHEWDDDWGAETQFLDLRTDTGFFVKPRPYRAVLMDQDVTHRATAPSSLAGGRARYSLVWKLIFIPKCSSMKCSIALEKFGSIIPFGSAARR